MASLGLIASVATALPRSGYGITLMRRSVLPLVCCRQSGFGGVVMALATIPKRKASAMTTGSAISPIDHCSGEGFHFHWVADTSSMAFKNACSDSLSHLSTSVRSSGDRHGSTGTRCRDNLLREGTNTANRRGDRQLLHR